MTLLLLAAALPSLFWDQGPQTAQALRQAGIRRVLVPASQRESWKQVRGIKIETAEPGGAVQLVAPGVNLRSDVASASRQPWVDSNGWKILRQPSARFYYEAQGPSAALAAAEAFCYGAEAMIHTDAAGLKPLGETLAALGAPWQGEPVADLSVIDDGSAFAGEVMNLLVRHNLLFRIGSEQGVRLPAGGDPRAIVEKIRADLGDDHRSLRIYGSPVVIGRLTRSRDGLRVYLLNYASATRPVKGVRVRVAGEYTKHPPELADYLAESGATEFTVPEIRIYTAIDLSR